MVMVMNFNYRTTPSMIFATPFLSTALNDQPFVALHMSSGTFFTLPRHFMFSIVMSLQNTFPQHQCVQDYGLCILSSKGFSLPECGFSHTSVATNLSQSQKSLMILSDGFAIQLSWCHISLGKSPMASIIKLPEILNATWCSTLRPAKNMPVVWDFWFMSFLS